MKTFLPLILIKEFRNHKFEFRNQMICVVKYSETGLNLEQEIDEVNVLVGYAQFLSQSGTGNFKAFNGLPGY